MGKMLDEIVRRVEAQCARQGIALWFDPARVYAEALATLEARGLPVLRGEDGFLALRRRADAWLDAPVRPTGVVWVPCAEDAGRYALGELASVSAVMSPTAPGAGLNTGLASVLSAVLPAGLAAETRRGLVAQAESGRFSLAELDALLSRSSDGAQAALAVVFGSTDASVLALQLLTDTRHDARLREKGLTAALAAQLAEWLSAPRLTEAATPEALRTALTEGVFGTVWRSAVLGEACDATAVVRSRAVLASWRDQRSAREQYVQSAQSMQRVLGTVPPEVSTEALWAEEAFEAVDDALLARTEAALARNPQDEALLARCEAGRRRFWPSMEPVKLLRWELLADLAGLFQAAAQVQRGPSLAGLDAVALATRYTTDGAWGAAWSTLDTAHRHMERHWLAFDFDQQGGDAQLEGLGVLARRAYATASADLAEHWLRALGAAGFAPPGVRLQRETFARWVRPRLEEGRVAYLLVDGLRYEMARELWSSVRDLGDAHLDWTLGTLPSITEVGMAALMPGAEDGVRLEAGRDDKLGLSLKGTLLRNRRERVEYLQRAVPGVVVLKLGDVVPGKRAVRDQIAAASLLVVTVTDELDGLGDGVNAEMARRLMDDVLLQLRRAIKLLFQLGVQHAVVTADHGHLFGDALESDRQIPAPGGRTVALHRRVWVGRGGAQGDAFVRFTASQLGMEGDLELALPRGTGCFTATGATGGYFHGGASPQELVVPVLTVRSTYAGAPTGEGVSWTVTPSRPKLTSMLLTVVVSGEGEGLFALPERRVRVEVRDGRRVVGASMAAVYGHDDATREVVLAYDANTRSYRANNVTLRLTEAPKARKVRVVMLDARTDQELCQTELEVALPAW